MAIALRNTSLQYLGSTPATPDWYFTPVVGDLLTLQGTDAAYITGIVDASGAVWQEAINHPVAAGATWPSGGYVQIWYTICTSTVSPALTITFNAAPNSDWIMDDWGGFTASVGTVLDAVGVATGNSTTPVGPTNAQAGSNELFLVQGAMNYPGIGAATFTNSFIAPNSTLDVVGSDYFPAYLIATDSAAHGTAVSAAGSSAQPWTVVQVVFSAAGVSSGYTVTFNANGGTGSLASQTESVATDLSLFSTGSMAYTGHTFTGWNTVAGGTGTAYANGASYPFTANVTLYAQWAVNPSYTVTFNANGGTGSMSPETENASTALTTNTYTRTSYVFTSWNTVAGGTGTAYANGASYPFTASVTLYAQWASTSFRFGINGGDLAWPPSPAYTELPPYAVLQSLGATVYRAYLEVEGTNSSGSIGSTANISAVTAWVAPLIAAGIQPLIVLTLNSGLPPNGTGDCATYTTSTVAAACAALVAGVKANGYTGIWWEYGNEIEANTETVNITGIAPGSSTIVTTAAPTTNQLWQFAVGQPLYIGGTITGNSLVAGSYTITATNPGAYQFTISETTTGTYTGGGTATCDNVPTPAAYISQFSAVVTAMHGADSTCRISPAPVANINNGGGGWNFRESLFAASPSLSTVPYDFISFHMYCYPGNEPPNVGWTGDGIIGLIPTWMAQEITWGSPSTTPHYQTEVGWQSVTTGLSGDGYPDMTPALQSTYMVEYLEAIEGMGVPVVLAFQLADYTPTYSSTGLYWGFATTYTDVAGGLPTVSPKPVFAAVAALFGGAVGIAAVTATASVGAAATLARLGAATASATASVSATYLSTSLAPVFTADTPTVTASVGVAYSYTFVASGSPSPTYSLSSGSLPPGLTLNTTTGVLSGTPTGLGGVYLFEIEATNSHGSATTPAIALVVSPAQAPYLVTYSPPITPHLALPLTVGPSGSFNVVVQDTLAEVTQSVSVLLGTMKGDRTMVPDYGVDDPTFATPNAGAITQAVNQWEPRAAVAVTVNPVANNTQQGVNVQVALAAEAAS